MLKFFGGVVTTLVVLFLGAYLVLSRAWFPIGADNAPGRLERRIAHLATHAWVAKNAPEQENPIALNAENLSEGARIYEAHCSVCHGGAVHKISPLQHSFSPPVPQLVNRVPHDPDADFFWITKHGYRLTGMPSWASQLSDHEIWTVVAFIKNSDKLPPEAQAAWQEAADTTRASEADTTRMSGQEVGTGQP